MRHRSSEDRFKRGHRKKLSETVRLGRLLLVVGGILVFAWAGYGTASAQTKYTTDDVMARVVEIDRRLVRVETEVENLKTQIREIKTDLQAQMNGMKTDLQAQMNGMKTDLQAQIQGTSTTMWTLFGAMITLYLGIFVVVLAVYKNVRPRPEDAEERRRTLQEDVASEVGKVLEPLQKQLRELAEREERLEKQVMALASR